MEDRAAAAHASDGGTPPDGSGDRAPALDALEAVRRDLDTVLDRPVADRAAVFERAHEVVVAELRALELG